MLAKLLAAVLLPPRFVGARRKQSGKLEMWTNKAAKYTRVPREECPWPSAAHSWRGPTVKAPQRPRYRPLLLLLSQLISSETRTCRFRAKSFLPRKRHVRRSGDCYWSKGSTFRRAGWERSDWPKRPPCPFKAREPSADSSMRSSSRLYFLKCFFYPHVLNNCRIYIQCMCWKLCAKSHPVPPI